MWFNLIFLLSYTILGVRTHRLFYTTDDLENHINPEDLREFLKINSVNASPTEADVDYAGFEDKTQGAPVPTNVDCFGLGSLTKQLPWLFNMKPDSVDKVNTHFYFSSREKPFRVQIYPGKQFGMEWVDFRPARRTVMIVHGFMSHSNASWVIEMTEALLQREDVNVIAVDWSGGGNTWKYWRAVANTRRVGADVIGFMRQLIGATGIKLRSLHFVGHSLGAHICSYVSYHLGGVGRITGLDPAQPCFRTTDRTELLDDTDADFVDVIHTNGRLLKNIGLGLPEAAGHADFYPNGGMVQPGCRNNSNSVWARLLPISPSSLLQAICSHGRAYLLFTESLTNRNCTFRAHSWNLTYEGINSSLTAACDRKHSCSEMGIMASGGASMPRAKGAYFVLTTEREPYCPTEWQRSHPQAELLKDLRSGLRLSRVKPNSTATIPYADPELYATTTTKPAPSSSWFNRWLG